MISASRRAAFASSTSPWVTRPVWFINPTGPSNPFDLAALGNTLYLAANDGVHGWQPWIVTEQATAPTLTVSDAGGYYNGSKYPATATVNGGSSLEGVTPTLTYYQGTYTLATLPTSGGSSVAPTAAANYTVVANFAGSTDYASAMAFANFAINPAPTTTTVVSSLPTLGFSQSVTFTATVTTTPGTPVPTGSVQFIIDGQSFGTPLTLTGGSASISLSSLAIGLHTVSATYIPDSGNFAPGSPAATINQNVLSAVDLIQSVENMIQGMVAAGTLSAGNGNALLASLQAAVASLDMSNTTAGVNQLTAFANKVTAFINTDRLSPIPGDLFIADIDLAIQAALAGGAV
jgi:hypothetical protein